MTKTKQEFDLIGGKSTVWSFEKGPYLFEVMHSPSERFKWLTWQVQVIYSSGTDRCSVNVSAPTRKAAFKKFRLQIKLLREMLAKRDQRVYNTIGGTGYSKPKLSRK